MSRCATPAGITERASPELILQESFRCVSRSMRCWLLCECGSIADEASSRTIKPKYALVIVEEKPPKSCGLSSAAVPGAGFVVQASPG